MRRKILTLLIIILGFYLLFGLGRQVVETIRTGQRLGETSARLQKAREENVRLSEELKRRASDEFLESEARNKLGFAKEGETIVILPQTSKESESAANEDLNRANWRKWLGLFVD